MFSVELFRYSVLVLSFSHCVFRILFQCKGGPRLSEAKNALYDRLCSVRRHSESQTIGHCKEALLVDDSRFNSFLEAVREE